MRRLILVLLAAAAVWACAAEPAAAQTTSTFPDVPALVRGPGNYLSWLKIAVAWLLFLCWVSTTDWINRDLRLSRLNYQVWNAVAFFPFLTAFLLTWVIPLFWVSYGLLVIAYLVPLFLYIPKRNAIVEPHQTVLSRDHLRFVFAERVRVLGIQIDAERKTVDELGPPVKLTAQGGATKQDDNVNFQRARQSPGYIPARELLANALVSRAEAVVLDFTREAVTVRYDIDGVWQNAEPQDRETGDAVLAVLKSIAALDPADRRSRQEGAFGAEFEKNRISVKLLTQGTKTGERALLQFVDGTTPFTKLTDLGMRESLVEQVLELLAQRQGFILFSAPPRHGLTTTYNAALSSADRYTRGFVAVEDSGAREREIENVPATLYDRAAGQTPMDVLPELIRTYPDVVAVRELFDPQTVEYLCEQVDLDRLVIGSIRANDCVEALLRVLLLKVPPARFAPTVLGAVNQRLVRRLCEDCKEPYPPPKKLLEQLRIPPGKVEAIYRPPQEPEKVCPTCGGLGYYGRAAFFEVLVADDNLREVLATKPKLETLRPAARQAGMRPLQEEGVLLALKGITSLAEVQRVLKTEKSGS